MERQPSASQRKKLRSRRFHKIFFIFDSVICLIALVISLFMFGQPCALNFFCFFATFYLGQSIQHYLCYAMPTMDVVRYDKMIKKYVFMISAIQIAYCMVVIVFWTKSDLHPVYCYLVNILGMPPIFGIIFIFHLIVSIVLYVQCLHEYITRKYYLLALGGFEVEQRLIKEREENLRRVALLEPFYNEYPIEYSISSQSRKTYKFDDIPQDIQGEQVCSICLTRDKEGFHPIYTQCKHFFHRQCIESWAKINSKCPQCRTTFKQLQSSLEKEPKDENY